MVDGTRSLGRREFCSTLAVAGVGALAGCVHPPAVLDMDEATADDIAAEVSMTADPGSEEYTLVTSARENGSATRTGRYELFDRTSTARVGDRFYEVSETRLESSEVLVYEVLVDFDSNDSTAELGEIAYEDLPAVDRERLEPLVTEESPSKQDGFDMGVDYGTAEEVGSDSVFVPERQYDVLVHGEDRYRVAVNSRTAPEAEYRYEVTEIAPDVDTFADQVRDRYLFALTGLSDAERAVVKEAIDETYYDDDEAFRSVVDRLRAHEGLSVYDFDGTWLVEYEGVEYITYAEW